jgi:hypothetical protein
VLSVVVSLVFALRSVARSRAVLHLEIFAPASGGGPESLALPAASSDRGESGAVAWLSQAWRGWRPALVLVKPDTVLAWHRRGFRLFWTWKSRHGTGRHCGGVGRSHDVPPPWCRSDGLWPRPRVRSPQSPGTLQSELPGMERSHPGRRLGASPKTAGRFGALSQSDFAVIEEGRPRPVACLAVVDTRRR